MNVTQNTINNIAAIFIESAEAAQDFKLSGDHEDLERHAELFKSADEKFEDLINADGRYYNSPLRDIRWAIVQGNYNDAKARYSAIAS